MTTTIDKDVGRILVDDSYFASTLLTLLVDRFGTEFFDWSPDTLNLEVRTRFGVEMPNVNRDKVWALVTCMTTPLFRVSLETFMPVCNVLSNSEADFNNYDPPTSADIAWAIVETALVDPPDNGKLKPGDFSHEVRRFITLTMRYEGINKPPAFLQPFTKMDTDRLEEQAGLNIGPDEHMLQAYTTKQKTAREELEQLISSRLAVLLGQLKTLPLTEGKVDNTQQFMIQLTTALPGLPTPQLQASAARQ